MDRGIEPIEPPLSFHVCGTYSGRLSRQSRVMRTSLRLLNRGRPLRETFIRGLVSLSFDQELASFTGTLDPESICLSNEGDLTFALTHKEEALIKILRVTLVGRTLHATLWENGACSDNFLPS